VQGGERSVDAPSLHLHPADQLSHRRHRDGAFAHHADPRHSEAQVAELVDALVDVWRTIGLEFVKAEILPMRRAKRDLSIRNAPIRK